MIYHPFKLGDEIEVISSRTGRVLGRALLYHKCTVSGYEIIALQFFRRGTRKKKAARKK